MIARFYFVFVCCYKISGHVFFFSKARITQRSTLWLRLRPCLRFFSRILCCVYLLGRMLTWKQTSNRIVLPYSVPMDLEIVRRILWDHFWGVVSYCYYESCEHYHSTCICIRDNTNMNESIWLISNWFAQFA